MYFTCFYFTQYCQYNDAFILYIFFIARKKNRKRDKAEQKKQKEERCNIIAGSKSRQADKQKVFERESKPMPPYSFCVCHL